MSGLFDDDEEQTQDAGRGLLGGGGLTRRRHPTEVSLTLLANNPFNPRETYTELEETAASLRQKGQLQPLAVVTRAAWLAIFPGTEESLGPAAYVVIDGNRRLLSAPMAELTSMRIDVNDSLAASPEDILESALIANIHRVDIPALEQARRIQELLERHGTQAEVARRLGKTAAWVSQRLALLNLPEDLQQKVDTGDLKIKDARRIGALPRQEQRAAAEEALNRVKPKRKPRRKPRQTATASERPSETESSPSPEAALNPVKDANSPETSGVAAAVEELLRVAGGAEGMAAALIAHLPADALRSLVEKLQSAALVDADAP